AAVPLDGLIAFNDAYRCTPGRDFAALLGGVIRWEELTEPTARDVYKGTLTSPPVPAAFRDQLGAPTLRVEGDAYRVTVPLEGTWRGLPLRALVVVERVESEGGFYLQFDATPEQVRAAANEAGFRIPLSGREYRDEEVLGVHVGVEG